MSSSIDKRFGDLFIFGDYKDGKHVDLVWSSHSGEYTFEYMQRKDAEKLMELWNNQRDEMHKLAYGEQPSTPLPEQAGNRGGLYLSSADNPTQSQNHQTDHQSVWDFSD